MTVIAGSDTQQRIMKTIIGNGTRSAGGERAMAARKTRTRKARGTARKGERDSGQAAESRADLLDANEAIEQLKTTRPTFYRWLRAGRIKGMKLGRQWRFYREDIDRFLRGAAPRIELPADISPLMETLSERIREAGEAPASAEGLEPVERAAQLMIALGAAMGASDVHITPHMPEGASRSTASCTR
jgi:excisionase family DNA binding protein